MSYADHNFARNRDLLCESAKKVGFDVVLTKGPDDLSEKFRTKNRSILSQNRGAGYWLWKPEIILQELERLSTADALVYSDAGRTDYYRFRRFPRGLLAKARGSEFIVGVLVPQHGPLSKWTKRDALVALDMDRGDIWSLPSIQATWSIWTKTERSLSFLRSWVEACSNPDALTDAPNVLGKPNLPNFVDHRHDQALVTLLAYRDGAPFLDYRNTRLFQLLRLRPQSALAHQFLKRLDDAESMECGHVLRGLVSSFIDLKIVTT